MTHHENLDSLISDWPYDQDTGGVRLGKGDDGREVILMRIELGVMQLEVNDRPDGTRPYGSPTYFAHIADQARVAASEGRELDLDEDQCNEIDREFVQFYYRRISWLQLQKYELAIRDADHTLALMDFCYDHSPDEEWTMTHEQYRPFVLYHRTQAAALNAIEKTGPEAAVHEMNLGLEKLRSLFEKHDAEEQFEENRLVTELISSREDIRRRYEVGRTLQEQLSEAVELEQYELAARLRDELSKRNKLGGDSL